MTFNKILKSRVGPVLIIPAVIAAAIVPVALNPGVLRKPVVVENEQWLSVPNSYPSTPGRLTNVAPEKPADPCPLTFPAASIPAGWNVAFSDSMCLALAYPPEWEVGFVGETGREYFIELIGDGFKVANVRLVSSLRTEDPEDIKILGQKKFFVGSSYCYSLDQFGGSGERLCHLSLGTVTETGRVLSASLESHREDDQKTMSQFFEVLASIEAR